jgi:uncharacterized protein GlcG (DUF336 family)
MLDFDRFDANADIGLPALLCHSGNAQITAPINLRRKPMIRSHALAAAAALAAFTSINAWAADPLPAETHKFLTAALAVEAAQAAIAACKAQGYNVTVTIADRTGTPKLILVGDGAGPLTTEVTRRKAYTSARQRVSTGDFTKRVTTPGAFNPGLYDPQLTTGQGGIPIKVGDDTIGGIATAGAPGGDKDEACAVAGLEKIKDRLN